MKKIIYIAFTLIVFSLPATVHAQANTQNVSLTPSRVHLPLIPGKLYRTHFTVVNNSNIALPLRVQFEPFTLDDETGSMQFNTKPGIHTWSKINKQELLLAPHSQQSVTVTTSIPSSVPIGGYASMLFFSVVSPEKNVSVQTQLGAFLTADIALNERIVHAKLQITSPFPFQFVDINTPLSFGVQNDSLSHVSAKPIVQISSWNVKSRSTELEEKLIFPGHTRQWKTNLTFVPWRPYYVLNSVVALGGGAQIAKRMIVFPIPPLTLFIMCMIVSLVVILVRRRKNIRKALRALYET